MTRKEKRALTHEVLDLIFDINELNEGEDKPAIYLGFVGRIYEAQEDANGEKQEATKIRNYVCALKDSDGEYITQAVEKLKEIKEKIICEKQ